RLRARQHLETQGVELPHLHRVAPEGADRRVLHRVVLRPDSGRGTEVRDPALGRDAGAGQYDARLPLAQKFGEFFHRRRVPRMGEFRFSTDVRVRFAETDAQGVVHNSVFLVWFEVARIAYLEEFAGGYPALRAQGLESFVLESHVRYRQPAHFDDRLRINARIGELRGARFRF